MHKCIPLFSSPWKPSLRLTAQTASSFLAHFTSLTLAIQRVGPSVAGEDQVWLRYSVWGDHLFCYGWSGRTVFEGGQSTVWQVLLWHFKLWLHFPLWCFLISFYGLGIMHFIWEFYFCCSVVVEYVCVYFKTWLGHAKQSVCFSCPPHSGRATPFRISKITSHSCMCWIDCVFYMQILFEGVFQHLPSKAPPTSAAGFKDNFVVTLLHLL